MYSSNALWRNNDESKTRPNTNKSWKWKHILKPIWDEKDLYTGNGLKTSKHGHFRHVCFRCLNSFYSDKSLAAHHEYCLTK